MAASVRNGFQLTVDDGGHFFVGVGNELTLGHQRAGRADLGFLADLGVLHARLVLEESLQDGLAWRIQALEGERVELAAQACPPDGRVLRGGDDVVLGAGAAFRFLAPDPASASARLRLHGADCGGAPGVLLFACGRAGRLRIASDRRAHVPVAGLDEELVLEVDDGQLRLERQSRRGSSEACRLTLPIERPFRIDLARSGVGGLPVGVTLAPAYSGDASRVTGDASER